MGYEVAETLGLVLVLFAGTAVWKIWNDSERDKKKLTKLPKRLR